MSPAKSGVRRAVLFGATLASMAAAIVCEFRGPLPQHPSTGAQAQWSSLRPGLELSETFTTPWNDFQSIDIRLKTEGTISGTLHLEVDRMTPRPSGVLESGVRRTRTALDAMTGDTTVTLRFPPILDSGGQLYRVRIFVTELRGGSCSIGRDPQSGHLILTAGGPGRSLNPLLLTALRGRPAPFSSPFLFWLLLGVMSVALSLLVVAAGEVSDVSFAPFRRVLAFRWKAGGMLFDSALVAGCFYAAYRIRFDSDAFPAFARYFAASLPVVIVCKVAVFYASGFYDRRWNAFGRREIVDVVRAVVTGSIVSVFAVVSLYGLEGFSRAAFLMDAVLLIAAMSATRAVFRTT